MLKFFKMQSAVPAAPVEWLIAGLGNPGTQYEKTRHNVGFLALDVLETKLGCEVKKLRFHGLYGEGRIGKHRVALLKPQTFMNASGESVREALAWYKLPPERLIVLHDDINLQPGRIRIRAKGSAGGQNGLKSIIYQLNSDQFPRVKIGVGMPVQEGYDLADWVLGTFDTSDGRAVTDAIRRAASAACEIVENGPVSAANIYNQTVFTPDAK